MSTVMGDVDDQVDADRGSGLHAADLAGGEVAIFDTTTSANLGAARRPGW